MNANTGNDLLTEASMNDHQYTCVYSYRWYFIMTIMANAFLSISLMLFLVAYALFEVPSNYLLKKLRPSVRSNLSFLCTYMTSLLTSINSDGLHFLCALGAL